MFARNFMRDQRGSAVQWFAYAAAALTIVAAVGAHGIAWFVSNDSKPLMAFLPLDHPQAATRSLGDPDMAATGSLTVTRQVPVSK